jgi:hypothetical protein
MGRTVSRRRFLQFTAAGLSPLAWPGIASAQLATEPPPKPVVPDAAAAPVSIEVNARPLPSFDSRDRSHIRFGKLEYRSGLVLTSRFPGFGGLSGLRLDARGERFISFSDKGRWFTGRIVYRGRDMTGLDDVESAPMLGPDGRPITARGWFDSESIALDGPFVYIGLERVNQVLRFDFSKGFTRARGEVFAMPPAVRKLPFNKGLEALVLVPQGMKLAGTLIAISERGLDAQGNLIAFLVGGPTPGQFSVRRTDGFDVSDAVLLPAGALAAGAQILAGRRRRHPDPAHSARHAGAGRGGRRARDLRGGSGRRDRQHGRHRRPRHAGRRHRADDGVRRQFLADPAHLAAAIHAAAMISRARPAATAVGNRRGAT